MNETTNARNTPARGFVRIFAKDDYPLVTYYADSNTLEFAPTSETLETCECFGASFSRIDTVRVSANAPLAALLTNAAQEYYSAMHKHSTWSEQFRNAEHAYSDAIAGILMLDYTDFTESDSDLC